MSTPSTRRDSDPRKSSVSSANRPLLRRWLWGLGVLAVVFFLAWALGDVSILLLLSFLTAYILNPVVTRLARLPRVGRGLASAAVLIVLTALLLLAVTFLVPQVVSEFRAFYQKLPDKVEHLRSIVEPRIEAYFGVDIPDTWDDVFAQVYDQIKANGKTLYAPVAKATAVIFNTTYSVVFALVSALMFPLFVFFLLKDFPAVLQTIDDLIPVRYRPVVHRVAADVDRSLSAYLHGQFTVMLVLGTLYSLGYLLVGVPLGLVIGALTGVLCFIPYLGAGTGFVLALLMAVFSFEGWTPILGVILVFGVVQGLDAVLITPRILGGKLGIEPLWIIVGLMAGGQLFGFLGVLLAVPTMAILKVLMRYTLDSYKHSALYDTGTHAALTEDDLPSQG